MSETRVDQPAESMQDPQVQLRLMGLPAWRVEGQEWQPLSRKDAALVAVLAVEGAQTRDRLTTLLWGDNEPAQARANLRQRVHRLRKACRHPFVLLGGVVSLAPNVSSDVMAEAAGPAREQLRPLGPFEYDEADDLARWVAAWRSRWANDFAHALTLETQHHEEKGELESALLVAQSLLALDPLLEHNWRRVMRLHYLRGDRAAALITFDQCAKVLADELSVAPSPETLALKATIGRATQALSHRFAAVHVALLRPPQLIGRSQQLAQMHAAWQAGRPFLLLASPGLGKTRLCQDFLQGRDGVLWVKSRTGDALTPYALLARWLGQVLGEWPVELNDHERRELARVLPELGPVPQSAGHQGVLWRCVESVMHRACLGGLKVLAIDDLHAADSASIELLRWLSASTSLAELRWALASRSAQGQASAGRPLAQWLADSHRPEVIALPAWTQDDVRFLVMSLVNAGYSPNAGESVDVNAGAALMASVAALYEHAGGWPFFTLETLKDLKLGPGEVLGFRALPMPATVYALIDMRLAELSDPARDLLSVAAVCGPSLNAAVAARVLALPAAALMAAWQELEQADVLRGPVFAHDLMQEAALRRVPVALAQGLHEAVAQALVDLGDTAPAQVAAHWRAAKRWREAGACLHQAGLAARKAGRLAEQYELLQSAAECWRENGDHGECFDAMYAALDSVLIRQGGAAVLRELENLHPHANSSLRRALLGIARADALLNLHRADEALQQTTALMPLLDVLGQWDVDLLCLHGQSLAQTGQADAAVSLLQQAAQQAQLQGDDVRALHVSSALAFANSAVQRVGAAIQAQREALRRAGAAGDAAEQALAQGNLAMLFSSAGLPQAAHEVALAARNSHADMGSASGVHAAINLVTLGGSAAWLGRFGEAVSALGLAIQELGVTSGGAAHAKARLVMAGVWLNLGRGDRALSVMGDPLQGTPALLMAQWHLMRARIARAGGKSVVQALADYHAVVASHPEVAMHAAVQLDVAVLVPSEVDISRLRAAHDVAQSQGATGMARALRCRLAHTLALHDAAAAAELAATVLDELEQGTHASLYPPQVAWEMFGLLPAAQQTARAAALKRQLSRWVEAALLTLPPEDRSAYVQGHSVHAWLGVTEGCGDAGPTTGAR